MAEKLVEIKNMNHYFEGQNDETRAIEDINLTIEPSEFITLLGPSGCGKSTLLNIIAGYIAPLEGEAKFQGETIESPSYERGVIFQQTNLYPWLNVEENISFGPRLRGEEKDIFSDEVNHFIEMIELEGFKKHYPHELSGGMQQRVAIARTLINKPKLVLMDEPFGALDAITRKKMQDFLRKLWHRENITIFMITHDIDEALSLGTRVLVMSPSPGTIIREFPLDFSSRKLKDEAFVMETDYEFINKKNEILSLLSR